MIRIPVFIGPVMVAISAGMLGCWSDVGPCDFGSSACAVVQVTSGGYVATVEAGPCGYGDIWIVSADSSGHRLWTTKVQSLGAIAPRLLVESSDKQYVLVALLSPATHTDLCVIKTDSTGVAKWTYVYAPALDDEAKALLSTRDGGFVVAGYTNRWTQGYVENKALLLKLSSQGTHDWEYVHDTVGNSYINAIVETSDGGYLAAGMYYVIHDYHPYTWEKHDTWLVKLDSSGNQLWERSFYSPQTNDNALLISACGNEEFIVVSKQDSLQFCLRTHIPHPFRIVFQ